MEEHTRGAKLPHINRNVGGNGKNWETQLPYPWGVPAQSSVPPKSMKVPLLPSGFQRTFVKNKIKFQKVY